MYCGAHGSGVALGGKATDGVEAAAKGGAAVPQAATIAAVMSMTAAFIPTVRRDGILPKVLPVNPEKITS
jgi:hypothetical protein